jgi:DegV family protein with EDD domain
MVKIVADTTSCLSLSQAQESGIYYLPQIIVIGDQSFRDDTELTPREFLRKQKTSPVMPKTAAPPPALYNPIFTEIKEKGDTALVLTPSAQVSGTFRSAEVASQDFPGVDIRVIDTQIIAGGLGAVVLEAQKWANQGLDADTITTKVLDLCRRHRVYVAVDTLEYLYKGGRIGAAAALVGSILQMKPILSFKDGHIVPFERQHTHRKAVARLKEVILEQCPPGADSLLCFMHGDAEDETIEMVRELAPKLGLTSAQIPIYDLTAAILTHAGPGVLAVSFFVKD